MPNRRVVLVDKDDDALPAVRGRKGLNGVAEVLRRGERLVVCEASLLKTILNMNCERCLEVRDACRRDVIELEVDNGILLPLPVRPVDGEPLEQLAASREKRLQDGQRQRLAEPPRTRDEIKARALAAHHAVNIRGLVYVYATILPKFGKVIRICRYRSHQGKLYQKSAVTA